MMHLAHRHISRHVIQMYENEILFADVIILRTKLSHSTESIIF